MSNATIDAELLRELLAELEDLRSAASMNAARVAEAEHAANAAAERADEAGAERDKAEVRADEAEAERDELRESITVRARRIGYDVLLEYGVDLGPFVCLTSDHEWRIDAAADRADD